MQVGFDESHWTLDAIWCLPKTDPSKLVVVIETNVLCLTVQKIKGYNGKKKAEVKASMGNRG